MREESGPSGSVASRRADESRDTPDTWRIDPPGFRENLGRRFLNESDLSKKRTHVPNAAIRVIGISKMELTKILKLEITSDEFREELIIILTR